MRAWIVCLGLSGCIIVVHDDKVTTDDTGLQCGSTQGFVFGTVFDPDGVTPVQGATVWADDGASTPIQTLTDSDGKYELNLSGGVEWIIDASYQPDEFTDCIAEDLVLTVEACEEYPHDFSFEECLTADKPNLYLYPAQDTPTAVRLELAPRQSVVASAPPYRGAWRGVAHPDGTFSVGSERAPFLFYEVSLTPAQGKRLQREEGWCLPAEGAVDAMAEILGTYGFDARERDDFVDAWVHDLPSADGYAVYPQAEVAPYAGLHIQPALPVHRLWLLVADGAGCGPMPEPVVVPFDREGAHGVEWGVVVEGLK
ncbi:MAG: hypothetical protein H6739_36725 [Alphaproteobacteria bacterium]|nr:hypothetical protein [Alphaproteobacteria bacterium]